jgi:uncharacterized protein
MIQLCRKVKVMGMNLEYFTKLFKAAFLSSLRILILVYIGLVIFIYFNQSRMVYFPSNQMETNPQAVGLNYESIKLVTKDNLELSGWFIPAVKNPEKSEPSVILFCHGNAGNIGDRLDYFPIFHSLGLSTLIFDYRGFGDSNGIPTEEGTYADVDAAWRYLTIERKIPADKIIVYGESLGGAIAGYAAQQYQPQALILASTFTSIRDRAQEQYPYLPIHLISKFSYNTIARLPEIKSPTLVIHSPEDKIISFHHGQDLFKAANEPKMFLKIHGSHNEGFLESISIYKEGLNQFLSNVSSG